MFELSAIGTAISISDGYIDYYFSVWERFLGERKYATSDDLFAFSIETYRHHLNRYKMDAILHNRFVLATIIRILRSNNLITR